TRKVQWSVAAAVVLSLGVIATVMLAMGTPARVNAVLASFGIATNGRYSTDIGERLAVNLKDGSQVTLNTNSSLQVEYTPTERHIVLTQGQALFEVAKDKSRPFVVDAGGRRFVAVGTAFDVRVDGLQVQVTMIEGVVRVEREPGQVHLVAPTIATITAGEQLTANNDSLDRVRAADAERETSWRRGQVFFDNTRLNDAVAEMNRYSETPIQLVDANLAELRISGAFSTARPAVFVEALTSYFPIDARTDEAAVLLTARQ
ncbi:FecR family protein, partial [Steroidobacter sp.]|uniref:FecR family protein n=1 Tax=Steroidobacter sp. TaxID=1978227 RepID=UPI001A503DE0